MVTWSDDEKLNAMRYGVCRVCGRPRIPETTRDEQGRLVATGIACPNGHPQ